MNAWTLSPILLALAACASPEVRPPPNREESVEDPALDRARALFAEARAAEAGKDPGTAREKVKEAIQLLVPEDAQADGEHRIALLADLGGFAAAAGELRVAERAQRRVLEVREHTLPEDDADLLAARDDLARTMFGIGDFHGARSLFGKALEVLSRTLPEGHRDLQVTRGNLAATIRELGDYQGARALQESLLADSERTMPEDHRGLQVDRLNLAATLFFLGDLQGARSLEEKVLAVFSRTLPEDHPDLQAARLNLAATVKALGDLHGARALEEAVLAVYSRTLPEDHLELQKARQNLAKTMRLLGDFHGARALEERVLAVRSSTLPEDHPFVQAARQNLAVTIRMLGDHPGARELEEEILEIALRTLPEDHRDLQGARLNLAVTLRGLGELPESRALLETALEVYSRILPEDHPDLQTARLDLAWTLAGLAVGGEEGEGDRRADRQKYAALAREYTTAVREAAELAILTSSAREAEERCANLAHELGRALSLAEGLGAFPADPGLEREAFLLSETSRGAAQTSAALARAAATDERCRDLRERLRAAGEEIARLVQAGAASGEFRAAVGRRDEASLGLVRLASSLTGSVGDVARIDLESLTARIAPRQALIVFRRYQRVAFEPGSARATGAARLCAFVVTGAEELRRVELGRMAAVESAVRAWQGALGTGAGRGIGGTADRVGTAELDRAGEELRRLVFDPLLPALGEAGRLVLVLDDVLHLVSFDALPAPGREELLGSRYGIELRTTLREMLWKEVPPSGPDLLVVLGGAAYSADPTSEGPSSAGSASVGLLRGGAWEGGFSPLAATLPEAHGISELSTSRQGAERAIVLEGIDASRTSLVAVAPRARWLHLATHGWFAPETVRSFADPNPLEEHSGTIRGMDAREHVKGTSPMVLCGLALAGANLPPDALGRNPGLVTAEEIASWDLSNCELAVLSACDTNVGERRAGQGVASLQKALHMAGARSVVTSLWKVPDEATRELMLDFYRRLWVEKTPKRDALWRAKMRLRDAKDEHGVPKYSTRDWAAWVLTGDPD